ncbi:ParB-like nuclease domain-containing protein [bacterium]|nr:ParB-like nuclease domain-containing protein [bacterium]
MANHKESEKGNQDQTTDPNKPEDEPKIKPEDKVDVLLDLGNGLFIVKGDIDDLREQDINAHTMPAQMFMQLADNIQDRGALESLPYCALTEKYIEIVSGHHRKRAAKAAGLQEIYYILDMSGLSREEIRSKQLAHNSLFGKDDPQIIKQIYKQIQSAEAKIRAYIDPVALEIPQPEKIPVTNILAAETNYRTVMFMFLPHQQEKFDKMVNLISKEVDLLGVADIEHFEEFKDTVQKVKETDTIISVGMIISRMCEIVNKHYEDTDEEQEDSSKEEIEPDKD